VSLIVCPTACGPSKSSSAVARQFTDETGRVIMVSPHPERIISLAPSVTETLYALGLGPQVVGVTSYCDFPHEATEKEKIGDTLRPSIEKIIALKPDLVIASTASQLEHFIRKLDEVGIPIYISSARDLDSAIESISRIGELTYTSDRARELTARLRARLDGVRARVEGRTRPRVFFILGTEPLITTGGGTFINDMIDRAGGQSISADSDAEYPQFSLETAIARQPEVIFLQAGEARLPDRLGQTPAARAGRVHRLDDALLLRPGPRIVDGLEQMSAKIHPE
jgi:iron complex transport system substrate-binding protein